MTEPSRGGRDCRVSPPVACWSRQAQQNFLVIEPAVVDSSTPPWHTQTRRCPAAADTSTLSARASVGFFQRPAHRLVADALHYLSFYQSVGHHLHRSTDSSLRRRRAGQGNQVGLTCPSNFFRRRFSCSLRPRATPLPPPHSGGVPVPPWRSPPSGTGYLLVHHWPLGLIRITQQQDAGLPLLIGCRPALGNQSPQSACSSTVSSTRYFFTITSLTTSLFVPVSTSPSHPTIHQFIGGRPLVLQRQLVW